MSEKHLGTGSTNPPKSTDIRLYSMKYCPFSQRVRMVLLLKNIPHEIVNLNLKDKPDWYYKVHPEGKVPALDTGSQIITESLDIVNYLDDKFPEPPLYPAQTQLKQKERHILHQFEGVVSAYACAVYNKDNKPLSQYMDDILAQMDLFEKELLHRGTLFFGGAQPNIIDWMIWPWSERSKVPSILFKEEFVFPKERFRKLVEWRNAMKEHPVIKEVIIAPERHAKLVALNIAADNKKTPVEYDLV